MDILFAKKLITPEEIETGKIMLKEIVSMLIGLIKSLSENRIGEDVSDYRDGGGFDEKREQE